MSILAKKILRTEAFNSWVHIDITQELSQKAGDSWPVGWGLGQSAFQKTPQMFLEVLD